MDSGEGGEGIQVEFRAGKDMGSRMKNVFGKDNRERDVESS